MNILADIFTSKTRAEFFRILFGLNSEEMHLRKIEREAKLTIGTIRQEAEKLSKLSLILKRKDGNRSYYKANKQHPLYDLIHQMVLRTTGVVGVLKRDLSEYKIDFAFIFGSVASGTNKLESDIDLFLVGDLRLRTVSATINKISLEIGREINAHVMKLNEFRRRKIEKEHFVTRILETPMLMVVGKENELRRLA